MPPKKRKFIQKLKRRFRLEILDENSFKKLWSLRISTWGTTLIISFLAILLICAGGALIIFTPLKYFIEGFPTSEVRKKIIDNSVKVDSLVGLLEIQSRYVENVKQILTGNIPIEYSYVLDAQSSTNFSNDTINYLDYINLIYDDSNINPKSDFSNFIYGASSNNYANIVFFPPVKGVVSSTFLFKEQHFGIDIVAKSSTVVYAAQSGTIFSQTWTYESGNVIYIQHNNNFITVYKHNASFLKNQGDYVLVGEPIAIVGNTGEYSTGPHLHFEIWHSGVPVNPEDFVSFK